MTEDSMVCLGVVVAGTVLTLRVVAIGCSVTCSTIFEDEDFLSNCIEPTNIGIIQPNEGEFAALSSVPLFACIWACLLGCCYNQCEEFVSRTLGCSLIVELLIYLILFAHIGAYLINLDNTFGGSTCAMNDDFNNAVNWTKTGLIISVIIVGMPCCVACVAICASALNDGETTTKPSTNTPTKPVVVVQAPPRTNHGSEVGLTHQQKRIVGGVMSYLLVEQCGFWIATDSKKASVLRSLKQQTPSGQTALRDAVIYGLVKMFALKMILNKYDVIGHQFIHIVLTDGMDNKSSHSPQEIKDMFQLIGAKLGAAYGKTFFIGIDLGVSEKAALQNIADIAGDAAELHHCQDVGLHHVFERIKINVGLQRRVLAVSDGENAVLMSENRLFLQPERQKFLVLFSLDKSGSMSGKRWDILQTALDSFFRGLDASDIIGCVLFNDDVKCITE